MALWAEKSEKVILTLSRESIKRVQKIHIFTYNWFEPFYRHPKGEEDLFTFFNTEFLDPLKGLEGFLCPGTNILGNIYNNDPPFGTLDRGLLTFEWLIYKWICFQGEESKVGMLLCDVDLGRDLEIIIST